MVVGAIGREVLLCPEGSTSQILLISILIIFPFSFKNNILVTLTTKFSFLNGWVRVKKMSRELIIILQRQSQQGSKWQIKFSSHCTGEQKRMGMGKKIWRGLSPGTLVVVAVRLYVA